MFKNGGNMLQLCEVGECTLGDCKTTTAKLVVVKGKTYRTIADLMKAMRDNPEDFKPGVKYTLIENRPILTVKEERTFCVTKEG